MKMRRVLPASLLALLFMSGAAADPAAPSGDHERRQASVLAQDRAKAVAAERAARARAAAAAAEAARLTDQRDIAAARLREAQANTEAAAARMQELTSERDVTEAALARDARALTTLLPLMQRLSHFPAETMLAVAAPPEEAVRGLLVIEGMSRQLEAKAVAVRREQAAAEQARHALLDAAPGLAAAEAMQAAAASELDHQIAAAQADQAQAAAEADAEAAHAADLASREETLRGLIERLASEHRAAAARAAAEAVEAEHQHQTRAAITARAREQLLATSSPRDTRIPADHPVGQLLLPVGGSVLRGWGSSTEAGPASGVTYAVPPGARVAAPCSGRVLFAAPFRSYGQLLILDCGGGYDAVLSGFARLDAKLGQRLEKGAAIGTMPDPGSGKRPALYVELRRGGVAVNPSPWLKASG